MDSKNSSKALNEYLKTVDTELIEKSNGFNKVIKKKSTNFMEKHREKAFRLSGIRSNLLTFRKKYKSEKWIKNFFVIGFYVKIFIKRLKENSSFFKLKKLKDFHFNIINDLTYFKEEKSLKKKETKSQGK